MTTSSENVTLSHDKSAVAAARSMQLASPRKVLGELSTNAQLTPKVNMTNLGKKAMTATPMKRSFAAHIDDAGFTYLKRRRLSYSAIIESTESLHESAPGLMHVPHEPQLDTDIKNPPSDDDRESSAERHSFSSLINYDPSSQNVPSSQARPPTRSPDTGPSLAMSQAETLRIRLQMAMYKVRTKQTAVSFDYLREDTDSGSRESSKAVQEAVDQLRQEAYAKLALSKVKPRIELTPASSKLVPSPQRRQLDLGRLAATPIHDKSRKLDVLTSSAVKGQVAEGLLGLKHGFQR